MARHTYFPSSRDDDKRTKAIAIAKARGDAATEWFKTNKLTRETQPEFNALMKSINKKFKP